MNMTKKTFDFNGTLLASVKKLTRWTPSNSTSMEEHLKKKVYVLCKPKVWDAKGPLAFDFVVAYSTGRVFSTIDEFEIALTPKPEPVPITDHSMQQRPATTWQPRLSSPQITHPLRRASTPVTTTFLRSLRRSSLTHIRKLIALCLEFLISTPLTRSLAPSTPGYQAFSPRTSSLSTTLPQGLTKRLLMPRHGRSTIIDTETFVDRGVSIRAATYVFDIWFGFGTHTSTASM